MTHYLIPETIEAQLPAGWTAESLPDTRTTVLGYPGEGFVSICWQRRCFVPGWCQHPRGHAGQVPYAGRGWQERLMADAIAALKKVYDEK